jgi:competence CoiA-like predicted nuclease
MFSAIDVNNKLIDIDTAIQNSSDKYFCSSCKEELIVKNGTIRIPHFAHKNRCDCGDYDNDMSEWHRNWQKKFPLKNREVVLKIDANNPFARCFKKLVHRADVLCYGYVIEFQNSPITSAEFDERTDFYNKLGYKVVWIFNLIEEFENEKITCYDEWYEQGDNGGKFRWNYASKTFINYKTGDDNVILLFQFAEENSHESDLGYMERVVWAIKSTSDIEDTNFKCFFTSYYPGNFTELMDKLKEKSL